MITQGTDGLRRGIQANGFNIYFKSFAVEVFFPALPYLSLTTWSLSHIEILEERAPWWNVDFFWVHSPGVARQCFTSAIIVKLLPLPHPPERARTDAWTNPSAQRSTQLRSVLVRVYAVSIQNQLLLLSHNFSNVMINSTSLNEAH
jgi:hypothetical protein